MFRIKKREPEADIGRYLPELRRYQDLEIIQDRVGQRKLLEPLKILGLRRCGNFAASFSYTEIRGCGKSILQDAGGLAGRAGLRAVRERRLLYESKVLF